MTIQQGKCDIGLVSGDIGESIRWVIFFFKRETLFLIICPLLQNNKICFLMFFCLKIKLVLTTFDKNSEYYYNLGRFKPNKFQR